MYQNRRTNCFPAKGFTFCKFELHFPVSIGILFQRKPESVFLLTKEKLFHPNVHPCTFGVVSGGKNN
jgi:hypothetical protein